MPTGLATCDYQRVYQRLQLRWLQVAALGAGGVYVMSSSFTWRQGAAPTGQMR
jgi:hypothetical protein